MKIAIVGATGVLGRALIPILTQVHNVRALVRAPETAQVLFDDTVETVECDLLAPGIDRRLPELLDGCDAVIHAATAIPKDFNQPGAWDANTRLRTEGTARLLAASLQVGAKTYLQQSIAFAYLDSGDEWIIEETPLNPARTVLIDMEQQVRAVPANHLRWCILRGGVFVGKDTFQDGTIERLRSEKEIVPCDGSSYIALIHVADMASAVAAAVERAPAGSTYNIVAEPLRQGDYLEQLAAAIGAPKPPRDLKAPCPASYRVSNAAARAQLGWAPTHGVIPH